MVNPTISLSFFLINKNQYSFFDLMYWIDSSGMQKYKMPLRKRLTPFINLSETCQIVILEEKEDRSKLFIIDVNFCVPN